MTIISANKLKVGQKAVIEAIDLAASASYRYHLMSMGLRPGVCLHLVRRAPFKGPIVLSLKHMQADAWGAHLALRYDEADVVQVKLLEQDQKD